MHRLREGGHFVSCGLANTALRLYPRSPERPGDRDVIASALSSFFRMVRFQFGNKVPSITISFLLASPRRRDVIEGIES